MTILSVPDMSCGHCKASVEAALSPMASDIHIDLTTRQVTLTAADTAAVLAALDEVGFPATVIKIPS